MKEWLKDFRQRRNRLYEMGGKARVEKQHAQGKLTARERLAVLFDEDSFVESNLFVQHRCTNFGLTGKEIPADGVITGFGQIDGRTTYTASQDFTTAGGTMGEAGAMKVVQAMQNALKTGDPFVFINDSGGARIQEGVDALSGYGKIFYHNVLLSGVVPQISVIAGPCAGGAAYSPALTDFIIQIRREGQMYITGPKVIKEVTGEEVTAEQLGGAESHAQYSGVVHFTADSGPNALALTRRLLSFLPSNNTEDPPYYQELDEQAILPDEGMNDLIPDNPRDPYDMRSVITRVVAAGDFLEVQAEFAPNIIVGFGRVNGSTVGIVANQPMVKAGVLDIDSSDKAARFIRFCNAFNIPLLTFVDVPGFMPGIDQEYGGIIRHGAKLLFAYAAATVPKVTVITRKAYGGAYIAMCCREMGADRVVAWPMAEIAVMGAEGAASILYKAEIDAAEDPKAVLAEKVQEYKEMFANPYLSASRGYLDAVIEPSETKGYVAAALAALKTKRDIRPQKKHGLIPL